EGSGEISTSTRERVKAAARADDRTCMRRLVVLAALAALLAAPAAASASGRAAVSWAQPQIKVVVAHGLLAPTVASFRPNDPLMRGDLADLQAGLTDAPPPPVPAGPAPVTMAGLDAGLVTALGLNGSARSFYNGARNAG